MVLIVGCTLMGIHHPQHILADVAGGSLEKYQPLYSSLLLRSPSFS